MGRVCEKHQEYFETACRWCEPDRDEIDAAVLADEAAGMVPETVPAYVTKVSWTAVPGATGYRLYTADEIQRLMNEAWFALAKAARQAKEHAVYMPPGAVTQTDIHGKPYPPLSPLEQTVWPELMAEIQREAPIWRAQLAASASEAKQLLNNGHYWDSDLERCLRCGHGLKSCALYSCESFAGPLLVEKKP